MNQIILLLRFIKKHILKIFSVLVFVIIFAVIIFPYSDLNDFISSQVLKATHNQIYVQFDKLNLNPFGPSVSLESATIETPKIDSLSIDKLNISPSVMSLIKQQPGGSVVAQNILGGNVVVNLKPESAGGKNLSALNLNIEKISLKEVAKSFKMQLALSGLVSSQLRATIDLAFTEQPDGEIHAQIQNFVMPATTVNLASLGALNVPEVKLSVVDLKSKLQSGQLNIESARIGSPTDDLSGTIKGHLGLSFRNMNGQIVPILGAYNIQIDLLATPAFKERVGFFLSFIDQFQSPDPAGTRYRFKLSATMAGMPPQMLPLQ